MKNILYPLFLGICASLALPPIFFLPSLICFALFINYLHKISTSRAAFKAGFAFGFGYFVIGLYWISISLFTDKDKFLFLLPFSVIGFPLFFANYIGLATLALYRFCPKKQTVTVEYSLYFASFFTISEVARSYLFTGFPWNLIGYSLSSSLEMLQITSIIGIFGLSFLVVFASSLIAAKKIHYSLIIIIITYLFGAYRMSPTTFTNINLKLVQANIDQKHHFSHKERIENLYRQMSLSLSGSEADLIIWPESSIPYNVANSDLRTHIAKVIPENTILLAGGDIASNDNYYNSITAINNQGHILNSYYKNHLVPFGEYIPFREFILIDKITSTIGDLSKGISLMDMDLAGIPKFSPLICYEIIFPGQVMQKNSKAKWILNVTNDAWFGKSSGPYQHYYKARVRAVEEGVPVIRSANTGISAIIDPYGRELMKLNLGDTGIIEGKLPYNIETYSFFHYYKNLPIICFLLIISIIGIRRK